MLTLLKPGTMSIARAISKSTTLGCQGALANGKIYRVQKQSYMLKLSTLDC